MTLHIKRIQSDIEAINIFNATPGSGVTRPTFSKEYQGATDYVVEELKKIGAAISICPAGNIRGRLSGSQKNAPAIMMGSHLDTVAHGGNLGEIKLLVDYGGFSPMAAIEAGTRISAQVLGLENELGTIEEGKIADLIMVSGNPLENIDILLERESMRLVMQGGNIARNDLA